MIVSCMFVCMKRVEEWGGRRSVGIVRISGGC